MDNRKKIGFINQSIIFRINLLMILMISFLFVIFGAVDYYLETKSSMADLHSELSITINRLSKTLIIPVWDLDTFKMTDSIIAEMQNKNIRTIKVYDSITDKILIGKTRDLQWEIVDWNQNVENPELTETHDIVHDSNKIALLEIEVTDIYIKEKILSSAVSQIQRTVLLMLFFIVILSTTIFVAVLKPIKKLTKTVRKISEGNINEPISIIREDELGYLAKNFMIMQETIKQKIDSLNNEIAEREKIEKELQYLQNYLSNIIDSMPSILIGVNSEGKVSQWNKTTELTTGISADTALDEFLPDIFPRIEPYMKNIFDSISSRKVKQEKKKPHMSEKGIRYEDITIYPLIANGVQGAVVRIDDMTEQVQLEEMMIQSEKMLSVGGLAAGMAHEINNPLAGMIQTANVMANRLGEKMDMSANVNAAEKAGTTVESIKNFMVFREIPRMLNTIIVSGQRISSIVNNMLSFARKSEGETSSHSLIEIIDKTLELASSDYNLKKRYDFKTIEIIKRYEADLPLVPCEETKIQQVLLNIFRNGAEAMLEVGIENPKLTISADFEKESELVCIKINDNGPGMSDEIRSRVFEPFFTTKPVGIGTGLGLSVSYFIITENHKGEMMVESKLGAGSTFLIKLPIENIAPGC